MTVEDLMKPRYKVIADYPMSPFAVDKIIEFDKDEVHTDKNHNRWNISAFKFHPHLFRRLEWYEERSIEDMPEYVKHITAGTPVKVKKYVGEDDCFWVTQDEETIIKHLSRYLPATLEEYNEYQSKSKTSKP